MLWWKVTGEGIEEGWTPIPGRKEGKREAQSQRLQKAEKENNISKMHRHERMHTHGPPICITTVCFCCRTVERSISVCTILAAVHGPDSAESHLDMKVGL